MTPTLLKLNSCLFYKVQFAGHVKREQCIDLFNNIKDLKQEEFKELKWFVLDVDNNAQTISSNFSSVVCRIASMAEQYGLKFALMGNQKLQELLTKNGVDRMIPYSPSKEEFFKTIGGSEKDNVRLFLNAVVESTISTMRVLLEIPDVKTEVTVRKDSKNFPQIQAGAMAAIISAHFNGNLVIGFSLDVFRKSMSRFLQMEITEVSPEIKDGAAEFLNVIIGQTKIKLNDIGFEIRQVIPSVIFGEDIQIMPMSNQSCVHIKCITELGEINIFLSTNSN